MAWQDHLDTVQKLYVAYYQRPADPQGLRYWAQVIEDYGIDSAVKGFVNSSEAQSLYQGDIEAVIKAVYSSAFGRDPETDGLNYWKKVYEKGWADTGTIVWAIVNGAKGDDAIVLENKLKSANNFTKAIDPELDGIGPFNATYSGDADAEAARDFLKDVNASTVKTESQAEDFIKEKIADEGDIIASKETVTGTEFTMTHDVETLTGTNSDDVFKGLVDFADPDNTTFQAGDKIIGGEGNDKVEVSITAGIGTNTVTPVEISGVETISFSDLTGNNNIINAIYFKDNPTISVYNVGGETGIDNIPSLDTKVVFSGIGNLSVDYPYASGTNDTVTVQLEKAGVSTANVSIVYVSDPNGLVGTNNIENLILDTTGTNYVQINGGANHDTLDSVKVTGDGENYIVLGDIGDGNPSKAGVQFTFDSSEATGNVTVVDNAIDGAASEITYKLGGGDDTVVLVRNENPSNDTIDGGDGTDTLKIDVSTANVIYDDKNDDSLQNVEKIVVYDGGSTKTATIHLDSQTESFEIEGGKNADIIEGGKGADTITTGKGNDKVILSSPFKAADKIVDFESGSDKIYIDLAKGKANTPAKAFGATNRIGKSLTASAGAKIKIITHTITGAGKNGGRVSLALTGGKTLNSATTSAGPAKLTNKMLFTGANLAKLKSKITKTANLTFANNEAATGILFGYTTGSYKLYMFVITDTNGAAGGAANVNGQTIAATKLIATLAEKPLASDIYIF